VLHRQPLDNRPDPLPARAEPAAARQPAGPLILEPSAVRLTDSEPDPEPELEPMLELEPEPEPEPLPDDATKVTFGTLADQTSKKGEE